MVLHSTQGIRTSLSITMFNDSHIQYLMIKPFLANVPILQQLKTPQNQIFFCVFRVYKIGTMATNGLIYLHPTHA